MSKSNSPLRGVHQEDLNDWVERAKNAFDDPTWSSPPAGSRPWLNSIFGCFSAPSTCLVTCCFPCITFGKTHHRLKHEGDMSEYHPINTSCIMHCIGSYVCLNWVMQAMQLQQLREQHHLEGSCAQDVVCSFCCLTCSTVQAEKESQDRARESGVVDEQYSGEYMAVPIVSD